MLGGAASSLLAGLFDGAPARLVEAARTRASVHYETGDPAVPVLSVCTPSAVRLPNSLVTDVLPGPNGAGAIGDGLLVISEGSWRVSRWWLPPRPSGLHPPPASVIRDATGLLADDLGRDDLVSRSFGVPTLSPSYDGLVPADLIGAGPGLTPSGDDVIAGALVAAHATADPRLAGWQRSVRELLTAGRTTAVSRAILHCALDGYATSELADYIHALCGNESVDTRQGLDRATTNLLAVGHSSGAALMTGVLHTLSTTWIQGAA